MSERSHLEHLFQYQLVRSRRFRKSNSSTFKDLQTQIQGFSRTMSVFKDFPGLENLEKKNSRTFKDPQEPWWFSRLKFQSLGLENLSLRLTETWSLVLVSSLGLELFSLGYTEVNHSNSLTVFAPWAIEQSGFSVCSHGVNGMWSRWCLLHHRRQESSPGSWHVLRSITTPCVHCWTRYFVSQQASSTPVEQMFGHGRVIMRPQHAGLGDQMLSAPVYLKCNEQTACPYVKWRFGSALNFFQRELISFDVFFCTQVFSLKSRSQSLESQSRSQSCKLQPRVSVKTLSLSHLWFLQNHSSWLRKFSYEEQLDPKPAPLAVFAAEFSSAKNLHRSIWSVFLCIFAAYGLVQCFLARCCLRLRWRHTRICVQ